MAPEKTGRGKQGPRPRLRTVPGRHASRHGRAIRRFQDRQEVLVGIAAQAGGDLRAPYAARAVGRPSGIQTERNADSEEVSKEYHRILLRIDMQNS